MRGTTAMATVLSASQWCAAALKDSGNWAPACRVLIERGLGGNNQDTIAVAMAYWLQE